MRLGRLTNSISCEYEMQSAFKKWLEELQQEYNDRAFEHIETIFQLADELFVKEAGRRPDFLIHRIDKKLHFQSHKLINIEAKCNDLAEMMNQLNDNSQYCDYSYAFIPDYTLTPVWFKHKLAQSGYGLLIYNYKKKIITEVLQGHSNKPPNKGLKKRVIDQIKLVHSKRQAEEDQQKLKIPVEPSVQKKFCRFNYTGFSPPCYMNDLECENCNEFK